MQLCLLGVVLLVLQIPTLHVFFKMYITLEIKAYFIWINDSDDEYCCICALSLVRTKWGNLALNVGISLF